MALITKTDPSHADVWLNGDEPERIDPFARLRPSVHLIAHDLGR